MKKDDLEALGALLGSGKVRTDEALLDARAHDYWAASHLRRWRGERPALPGCVVQPHETADVQKLLAFANERGIAVIPFGLGSGVCGGVIASPDAILLDMSAMNRIREIDEINLLASFDAGKNGLEAEEAVAALGLTTGHWPQSIGVSSVGGWVSTRASGQFSTAYGNIEDIIYAIEAVLPNGELVRLGKAPRAAAGPDLRHLLMGAEGIMGVVTGVTLSLRRKPEARGYSAFYAGSMEQGFEAQRRIIQSDWRPPVMRQYDHPETARNFPDHAQGEKAVLLMVHEGPQARVEAEIADISRIALAAGLEQASPAISELWLAKRNHVPTWTEAFEHRIVADTVEISGKWTDIAPIYHAAIASLGEVPGIVIASAHSSHVYRSGINLYFTFAVLLDKVEAMEPAYFECWRRILEATAAHGGGIAHHHGAGRIRKDFIVSDLGISGVDLLRRLKDAIDPHRIMNPGNLLPDRPL
ncbi:MAG: FAD-binding oxidoreductase [Parvibaculaceae bacterium]|nr:FAD-binding oxidoreductase [Parvibaculaceae bacterium]